MNELGSDDKGLPSVLETKGFVGILLRLFEEGGELDVAEIVKSRHNRTGYTRYCINKVTDVFEQFGLADVKERRPDDGRGGNKYVLILSAKGKKVAERLASVMSDMHT